MTPNQKVTLARLDRVFLAEMRETFAPPRGVDEVALLNLYARDLEGFPDDVVRTAYDLARREYPTSVWPRPEAIRKHCLSMSGEVRRTTESDSSEAQVLRVNKQASEAVDEFLRKNFNPDPAVRAWLHKEACRQIRLGQEPDLRIPEGVAFLPLNGSKAPARGSVGAAVQRALDDTRRGA